MLAAPRLVCTLTWNTTRVSSKLLPACHASMHTGTPPGEPCRCGIIGAGLGGTSAAYYMRQLWGDRPLTVDVFEPQRVGGRLALVNIDGADYEAGGAVIHPRNWHMVFFADHFGLGKRNLGTRRLGLYNNEDGLYFETSSWDFITRAKLFIRYGRDLKRIQGFVNEMLGSFDRIYEHQYDLMAFTTVDKLLRSMDERFPEFLSVSTADLCKDLGLSERFINEVIKGGLIRNYSQTIHAPGFLGSISMAAMQPGLWAIQGGQRRLAEKFLEASGATLIPGEVTHVYQTPTHTRHVTYEVGYKKSERESGRKQYDILIIAAPLDPGREKQIHFEEFPAGFELPKLPYHPLQVLFASGHPNETFFGKKNTKKVPTHIIATETDVFFNKIGRQSPVDNGGWGWKKSGDGVWKIYMNKTPTDEQLDSLFEDRKNLCLVHWRAYPDYKPLMELPPFVLHDRLYYTSAIEAAASAMEMVVIGGRNVANLAHNQWFGLKDKIDAVNDPPTSPKVSVAFYK